MLRGSRKANSKSANKTKGDAGEDYVERYLKSRGHTILGRNIRYDIGELDIVTQKDNVIVCVEVKTQHEQASAFAPEDHFDSRKSYQVKKVFKRYITEQGMADQEQRIDLACVVINKKDTTIRYYENVVEE